MQNVRLELSGFIDTKEAVLALAELIGQQEHEALQDCCVLINCSDITGFSASALYYLSRVRRNDLPGHRLFLIDEDLDFSIEISEASLLVV